MSTFLVLGGAGAMGQIVVQDLADTAIDSRIIAGDFRFEQADRLKKLLERNNVEAKNVDIHDEKALLELVSSADCVINATPYYFNARVMKAALAAKRHYLDLGGLFHMTREQLQLHEQFVKAELLAILGVGATPGTTNIMAEAAARRMDKVFDIDIFCGAKELSASSHPFYPPYMLDTLLDEYTLEAMVYQDGELKTVLPATGAVDVDFPEPVGRKTAIYTLHSELATMPDSYKDKGIKNVSFRLALEPSFHEKLKLLTDLGFGDKEKITTEEGSFTPRKMLGHMISRIPVEAGKSEEMEILMVDVRGELEGRSALTRMIEIAPSDSKREISGGDLNTGVPPSIVAQMLCSGQISPSALGYGVLPAEKAVEPELFFEALGKRGIQVRRSLDIAVVP